MALTAEETESPVDYHSRKEDSRSMLAVALESWRTYEGMFVTGECPFDDESIAMQIGSFTHQQVLEPHLDSLIQIIPESVLSNGAKRGKAWTEYKAANVDKVLLKQSEYDDAMGCVNALRKNLAGYIFHPQAEREVEIYWTHVATGLPLRAKLDLLIKGRQWVIPDLKTCNDIDRFTAEVRNRNLWLQVSHYRAAVKAEFGAPSIFKFVVVEKGGVHRVQHFELDGGAIELADQRYEQLLVELAARKESGDWSEAWEHNAATVINSRQCFRRTYEDE